MTTRADVLATLRECRKKTEFLSCGVHYRIDAAIAWVEGQPDDARTLRSFPCSTCGVTYVCEAGRDEEWLRAWQIDKQGTEKARLCDKCGRLIEHCDDCYCDKPCPCARVLTFGPDEGRVIRD